VVDVTIAVRTRDVIAMGRERGNQGCWATRAMPEGSNSVTASTHTAARAPAHASDSACPRRHGAASTHPFSSFRHAALTRLNPSPFLFSGAPPHHLSFRRAASPPPLSSFQARRLFPPPLPSQARRLNPSHFLFSGAPPRPLSPSPFTGAPPHPHRARGLHQDLHVGGHGGHDAAAAGLRRSGRAHLRL
jgi:hypothetical protein